MHNHINVAVGGPVNADYPKVYQTKFLKPGIPFALQVADPNTKYVIKHNYDLGGESVTIPEGCVLEFDGGVIDNGTIVGNGVYIDAGKVKIFGDDLNLSGNFNVKESYPEWFGVFPGGETPDENTVDATPAIKKLVYAGMPVQLSDGTYFLSECLINGISNVFIKGTGTHYKIGTTFKAFYPNSQQRFILKLGGEADFVPKIPERAAGETDQQYNDRKTAYYESIWCADFILEGIRFRTYDTTFVNADQTGTMQNYAACCFDWAKDGYVDIRTGGACPGVFIANSWEIVFQCLCLYGSITKFNESALYFGKVYSNLVGANISAVTIKNLFAETVYGKVVDSYIESGTNSPLLLPIIIENIEFEPNFGNEDLVSHVGEAACNAIHNNIRNMDVNYFFNFGPIDVIIRSLTYTCTTTTYKDDEDNPDAIARGLIRAAGFNSNVFVDKITNVGNYAVNILGADNNCSLEIKDITMERNTAKGAVYTITNPLDNLSNIASVPSHLTGRVTVKQSNAVIDCDRIKEYDEGLLFNSDNFYEVSSIDVAMQKRLHLDAIVGKTVKNLLYFNRNATLDRKFKFNGNKLIFNYIAPTASAAENIIVTYYMMNDGTYEAVHTDNIKLNVSYTKILKHEYTIYSGYYDYCTITFGPGAEGPEGTNGICIESVELVNYVENDSVLMFPSQISDEVKTIMSNYAADDAYKQTALQYFFNKIAPFKSKIKHMILPLFATTDEEAIYDIITGESYLPVSGTNHLTLNTTSKRAHLDEDMSDITWADGSYRTYAGSTFDGTLAIISTTDDIGHKYFWGKVVLLNDGQWLFAPKTHHNQKIIGCGIVGEGEQKYAIRLGDNSESDNITSIAEIPSNWDDTNNRFFGSNVPTDLTKGTRILVTSDEKLTIDETKTLRDAVIALDNKYFN